MYVCMYVCSRGILSPLSLSLSLYIYIYIEREREREERERGERREDAT